MKISDLIKMGLRNLKRRKARTALTVIGVVIGTISIMVMISIGLGMNKNFQEQIMKLGSLTTVTIQKFGYDENANNGNGQSYEQKIDENLLKTLETLEHVKYVTPILETGLNLTCGKFEAYATLYGINVEALEGLDIPGASYGEYPTESGSETLIVGSRILENFYNPYSRYGETKEVDPLKEKIIFKLNDWNYEQVMDAKPTEYLLKDFALIEKGEDGDYNQSDYSIYVDINTYKKWYTDFAKKCFNSTNYKKAIQGLSEYGQIKITVDNVKNVKKVQQVIKDMGYQSTSLKSMLQPYESTSNMLQMVLGGVGAIAMLVSAISIANTMVMSIYERTKEIGVMKVLGCVVSDVKKLFLFEAAMIGLLGGVIGVIISYITSYCINKFGGPVFQKLLSVGSVFGESTSAKYSIIPIWLPLLAAGFAMIIGMVSGYYPAKRATKISAIEAMKTEG